MRRPQCLRRDPRGDRIQRQVTACTSRAKSARALRPEDAPSVTRLFDYLDRRAAWWDSVPATATEPRAHEAVTAVKSLESMITALAASIGFGPRARRDLGIMTELASDHVSMRSAPTIRTRSIPRGRRRAGMNARPSP